MSKLKELLFPGLAGLDAINEANIDPRYKLDLLNHWRNPHASRRSYKQLVAFIKDLEEEGGA